MANSGSVASGINSADGSPAGRSATPGRLAGKRAVVIGAGSSGNIGHEIARALVNEGAKVVIAARKDAASLEPLAAEIGARAATCDITDPTSVKRLFDSLDGPLDIAVNSVGRPLFRSFLDTSVEDMSELSALHLTGPLLFTQGAVRAMPSGGSIIHISSLTARSVLIADHVAYMATKAAGEVLVRAAALEFGPMGIRVNGIAPALTQTPMTQPFFANENLIAMGRQGVPLRRLGTVQDVANAAVWLAGDEAFMTGEILQINGGMAMHALPSVT